MHKEATNQQAPDCHKLSKGLGQGLGADESPPEQRGCKSGGGSQRVKSGNSLKRKKKRPEVEGTEEKLVCGVET